MDGVIVDTAVHHYKAWRRMAEELSIDIDESFNERLKGLSRVDSLDVILSKGDLELDNLTKHKLMEQKNAWYLEYISGMTADDILPGVVEFFDRLDQLGIRKALGSSSKNARIILDRIGMASRFDVVVDGTHITFSKPDPEVFLKGSDALGMQPSEIIVFEDAVAGVEAAKAGGFHCVGVGDPETLKEADFVIQSLSEISEETLKNYPAR